MVAAAALSITERAPTARKTILAYNVTASVPRGLYRIRNAPPKRGDIAAVRLPASLSQVAETRAYLPPNALVLKPAAAVEGDRVCRRRAIITINGVVRAVAAHRDAQIRPLPVWHGCHVLAPQQIFVLSPRAGSFDGRYFGVLDARYIIGTATALWTIEN